MHNPTICERCKRERAGGEWFWTYRYPDGRLIVCSNCYCELSGAFPLGLREINEERGKRQQVTR